MNPTNSKNTKTILLLIAVIGIGMTGIGSANAQVSIPSTMSIAPICSLVTPTDSVDFQNLIVGIESNSQPIFLENLGNADVLSVKISGTDWLDGGDETTFVTSSSIVHASLNDPDTYATTIAIPETGISETEVNANIVPLDFFDLFLVAVFDVPSFGGTAISTYSLNYNC